MNLASGKPGSPSLPRGQEPDQPRTTGTARALCAVLVLLALGFVSFQGLRDARYVSELSLQGAAPPALDDASPTGYAGNLRHFLGLHDRGETYRWIETTQDMQAHPPLGAAQYESDTAPTGRPQSLSRIHAAWLTATSWIIAKSTGVPHGLAVERAALWSPVFLHLLIIVGSSWILARRFGPWTAAMGALTLAAHPLIVGQFIPGVLSARGAALALVALALAAAIPTRKTPLAWGAGTIQALALAVALALEPSVGFPAVLMLFSVIVFANHPTTTPAALLRWSISGALALALCCLLDRSAWDPSVGELRTVHLSYAFAWLGLGLIGHGALRIPRNAAPTWLAWCALLGGIIALGPLIYLQLKHGYAGWFYPSVWLRHFTEIEEDVVHLSLLQGLGQMGVLDAMTLAVPLTLGAFAVGSNFLHDRRTKEGCSMPFGMLFIALAVLTYIYPRWAVVAVPVSLLLFASLLHKRARKPKAFVLGAGITWIVLLSLAQVSPSAPFDRDRTGSPPSERDLQALVHRDFAHWLAKRNPSTPIVALAPPEMSDSIIFHGGGRALMSTAWQSYPGQLAASRVLSALESTEAEAVLSGHGVTHLMLTSWDEVLPVFARKPIEAGRENFHERLERWVFPPYLRPIPYPLPPSAGLSEAKLALFEFIPAQDDVTSLAQLAEYFVESGRGEPAELVGQALTRGHPEDPSAAIALATLYAASGKKQELEKEMARLISAVESGHMLPSWERRVQRAIILAVGRRHTLAQKEVTACLEESTPDSIRELTPLQAFRLHQLCKGYRIPFPSAEYESRLLQQAAPYAATSNPTP